MSTPIKITLILATVLAVLIAIPVVSYITHHNQAVRYETGIEARHTNARNTLSRVSTSVLEAVQVPEIAKNDIVEVIEAATSGRYGEDGASNVFLSIQEADPGRIDPSLYTQIQDLIAAGRMDFQREQTMLIDIKADYEIAMNSFWSGLWMRIAGFPRIDPDDYDIVVDERTDGIFSSGRDTPLQLGQ